MKKYLSFCALIASVVMVMTGCTEPANNPAPGYVMLNDPQVERMIRCESAKTYVDENGLFTVEMKIVNLSEDTQAIRVKTEFLDETGAVVDYTPFKPVVLTGKGAETYRAKATKESVVDLKMTIVKGEMQ